MTIEFHPYGEFIPKKVQGMIIGSFPIGKFSNPKRSPEIKAHEFDFFFGGEKNLLWKLLAHARNKELRKVSDIIQMLEEMELGIGDVIKSCKRKDGGGSDSDLYEIEFNIELMKKIRQHDIKNLYFTSRKVEKWFNHLFPESDDLKKISLISPSAQTLRSLVKNPLYLKWKEKHPQKRPKDFLFADYDRIFSRLNRKQN